MRLMRFGLGLVLMAVLSAPIMAGDKKKIGSDPAAETENNKNSASGAKKNTDEKKIRALFAKLMKASIADDIAAFAKHMTKDSQRALAGTFYIGGAMMVLIPKDKAKAKKVEAIFKNHDVDKKALDDLAKEIQSSVKKGPPKGGDFRKICVKFGARLKKPVEFMAQMIKALPDNDKDDPFKDAKMDGLKIDGDSATARVKSAKYELPIEFKKVDGQWKLELGVGFFEAMLKAGAR